MSAGLRALEQQADWVLVEVLAAGLRRFLTLSLLQIG